MKRLVWIIALPVVVGVAMYGTFSNTTETTATSSELGGALHTNFSVNSQGASTFNIPLHVAPGTNKNQPGLALTYNSLQGNGMLGVGWTLSGLSVIERVPATVAQDGFWGSINYDSNDRFALDGHRLMLVRAYGNDSCLYHTEVESWSKVMAYGQQANPNSFVVYTKNGHRVEYGTTSDAQIQNADQSAIRSWAMNKSMDLNRNFFTVQYLQLTGKSSYYPQRIDYTYHVDTAGDTLLNSQRAVVFAYQSRVDTVPDFSEGGLVQDSLLLCKVTSMVLDDSIMHYALDYEFDSLTALSRLVDIRQIDGLGNALPTTTFDYQTASDTLFMPIAPPDTLAVIPQGLSNFSVDVNGDGKTDLLQFWPQSHTLYYGLSISQGQHLESPVIEATALNYSISQIQLFSLDIDGNGDQEVVAQFGTYGDTAMYYVVFDYNGSKLNVSDTFTTHLSAENITLMGTDVNGDGKGDLLYVSGSLSPPSMLQYAVGLSNGSAFVFPDSLTPTALPWSPNLLLVPARINDDPMTDLVFALIDSSQATLDLVTLLSTGDQFQLTDTLPTAVGLGYNQIIPMDMNGDGLTDIGLSWQPQGQNGKFSTFLSNSTGLDSSYTVLYDFPNNYGSILPLDLNGDNKSDFLFRGTNNANEVQFTPYLSNGIQFSVKDTLPSTGVSWTDYIDGIPGDVNGDGKSDIIHLTSIPQILTECQYTLMFANATYPNLIDGYSNGIGGQIEVTYKPLTDTTVYRKSTVAEGNYLNGINALNRVTGANFPVGSPSYQNCNYGTSSGGTFPVLNVDFPRYAVSSYSKSDGRGSRYPYGLFYEEALMDMNGRWWLGFQSKSLVDSSEQSIAQTYYQQAFPFTGLVDSSIVRYLIDNSKLYGKRFTYDSLLLQSKANDSIYMVQKKNSSTDYFDYGSYAFTTGKNYTYDAYGNVKSIENLSDTAGTQPVVYELHEYQNDTGIWQLGFLTSRQLATTKSGSDTLQYKAITYDNNKNILSKADWDDQQQRWITHQFGYDPYGNQQFVVDPSGDTTTTVYDSVYFSFIAQTVSPSLPNLESGNTIQLVTTTRYDSAFGVQLARTDANGNSFYQALDGLGRVIAKYGPDPNDSTTLLEQMSWTNVGDSGYAMLHQQLQDWGSDNWVSSQVYYDGLIRKYRTVGLGNSPSQNRVTEMHLDSKNRVVWQSLPYFQHQTGDYGISHQYDPYGNLTKIVLPKGTSDSIVNTYTYFYTEKEVKRVHAKGTANAEKLHTGFDFYFNKRRHAYYVAANGDTTWLSHDPLARLSGALDPKAIPTQISYSSLSRKVLINDPSFQQVHYQYLDSLKTAFQINANGDSIVERMDALNRIAVKKYAPFDSIQYRYDQGAAYNSLGRLSEVLLPGSDLLTYEYDAYGHPSKISLNIDSKVLFLEYQYRPDGKLSSITYPDSSVLQYSYTAQNWLKYLQFWDGVTHDSTTYGYYQQHNAQGQAKLISYGNNTRHEYSYDPTGMVDSTRLYLKDANGNDSLAVQHAYAHDYLLRLTQLSDLNNADLSQSFYYDTVGRLDSAFGFYNSKNFAYDVSGNLKSKDSIQYGYTNYQPIYGIDQNTADTVFKASYMATGNRQSAVVDGDTFTYQYDGLNQLTSVWKNGTKLDSLQYDHKGQRIKKVDYLNNCTTYYLPPHYEVTVYADSITYTNYVMGLGDQVASISRKVSVNNAQPDTTGNANSGFPTAGVLYFYQDHVHSTQLTATATGQLSSQVFYEPFGDIYQPYFTGPDNFRAKFGSKELDAESDLYYFSARYYDPLTARFLTPDAEQGGKLHQRDVLNRYAYTFNDPVNVTDPSGHKGVFSWLASLIIDVGEIALGGATDNNVLLQAGIGGLDNTVTNYKTFSWKSWGIQEFLGGLTEAIAGGGANTTDLTEAEETGCFVAGTLIQRKDASVPIETIQIGDSVWSYQKSTGQNVLHEVVDTSIRTVSRLVLLQLGGVLIATTEEHPFWRNGIWVAAGNLSTGDSLRVMDGTVLVLESVVVKDTVAQVYNFEVAFTHNYYVSGAKVLVHNVCGGGRDLYRNRYPNHYATIENNYREIVQTFEPAIANRIVMNGYGNDAANLISSGETFNFVIPERDMREIRIGPILPNEVEHPFLASNESVFSAGRLQFRDGNMYVQIGSSYYNVNRNSADLVGNILDRMNVSPNNNLRFMRTWVDGLP